MHGGSDEICGGPMTSVTRRHSKVVWTLLMVLIAGIAMLSCMIGWTIDRWFFHEIP